LETILEQWQIMTTSYTARIRERVQQIETMPAIPAVFLPLLKMLNNSVEDVKLDEVVRLVSYDNTIAAQCLRVAGSPIFGLAQSPKSIKGAVISLGLRRVETILLTCCLPSKKVGARSGHILATFTRVRPGVPEIQREASCRRS
jgi:HD-like signal output (HDOD) protein